MTPVTQKIKKIEDKIFSVQTGWKNGIPSKTFTAKDTFKTSDNNPLNLFSALNSSAIPNDSDYKSARANYKNQSNIDLKLENQCQKDKCSVVY